MTTKFQTYIQRLQERGVFTDQQEEPCRLKDHIPMRCPSGHNFIWNIKFVEQILNDPNYDNYPCLCPCCRSEYSIRMDAEQECQRLGVVLMDFRDRLIYFLKIIFLRKNIMSSLPALAMH